MYGLRVACRPVPQQGTGVSVLIKRNAAESAPLPRATSEPICGLGWDGAFGKRLRDSFQRLTGIPHGVDLSNQGPLGAIPQKRRTIVGEVVAERHRTLAMAAVLFRPIVPL